MSVIPDRETAAFHDRVLQYYPLARAIACRIHQRLPRGVDLDDLMSSAVTGLLEAMDRYDPAREVSFQTYAKHRIQGAVMDSLRNSDWVPRSVRRKAHALEQARHHLAERGGSAPNRDDLARYLELSPEALDEMIHGSEIRPLLSLDAPASDEGSGHLADAVADPFDLHGALQGVELRHAAADAVNALPDRERTAIILYYFHELSLKEVGSVLQVTESRACQLCTQGVKRLRLRLAPMLR
jgi:RNA polymerase sigma factor for flagellar operon FliA